MQAHDDTVTENVYMSLHEGDRFGQDIIACTYQIHIQHLMVSHHAEYSLVVIDSLLRIEGDDDASGGFGIDSALYLREREHVLRVSYELEHCWQFTIVYYVKEPIGVAAHLNLSKVNAFSRESYIEASGVAHTRKAELVASHGFDPVLGAGGHPYYRGHVLDSYFEGCIRGDHSLVVVYTKCHVLPIITHFLH